MKSRPLWLLLLLVLLGSAAQAEAKVWWKSKAHSAEALPADMPPAARDAVETWAAWAKETKCRLDLSEDGSVLLVSSTRNSQRKQQMALVEDTIALFDRLLPPPTDRATLGQPLTEGEGGDALPDDPEGEDDHPWDDSGNPDFEGEDGHFWSWGAGTAPPDTGTAILFVVRDQKAHRALMKRLAEVSPYLEEWVGPALQYSGFVLEQPLAGAWVEVLMDQEEWHPDGELVNRVARLLLLRRFGRLPHWFEQGWAWHAELTLRGAVYCFPWRREFVFATEHTGWDSTLRARFSGRRGEPLHLAELAGWARNTYDDDVAKSAWGMVAFLVDRHHDEVSELLEEIRVHRDRADRVELPENEWRRDPGFSIPLEVQDRILSAHLGEDYLLRATVFFRED